MRYVQKIKSSVLPEKNTHNDSSSILFWGLYMVDVTHVDISTRGIFPPHQDTDIGINLDRLEVDELTQSSTQAVITAVLVANGGPYGAIAAQFFLSRIGEIQANKGPAGTHIELTIRDGTQLHVFSPSPRG
jgi:hypothetical protein